VNKLTSTADQQGETPSKLTENQKLKALVYPFKVIVSPFKAFKEIAQNPDIKGFALIIGLILLATLGVQFSWASKIILTIGTQPTSLFATTLFPGFLLSAMIETIFVFLLNWLVFSGALFLITMVLSQGGSPWRRFLILIGYAFSVFIIRVAASAVLISTLPEIDFRPLATWPPITEDEATLVRDRINAAWGDSMVFQVGMYFNLAIDAWLVMLGAIAVHASREITWSKAVTVSVIAYFIYFTLRLFIGF